VRRTHSRRPALERKRRADLRANQIEARVGIGLATIGEVLIECAGVDFPMVVNQVIDAGGGQDIEGKILTLTLSKRIRAIDKTEADTARRVGLQAPAGPGQRRDENRLRCRSNGSLVRERLARPCREDKFGCNHETGCGRSD